LHVADQSISGGWLLVALEPAPLRDGLYDRVGGWLVLPAIATYLTPILMGYSAFETLRHFSPSLPTTAQQIIIGAGLLSVALCIGWLYACVLLSRLDPYFPRMFVILSVANVVANFIVLVGMAAYTNSSVTPEDSRDAIRATMQAVIWVPYMLLSKRVKATFYGIPLPTRMTQPHNPKERSAEAINESEATRYKRKGHRLGIFLTFVSLLLLLVGAMNESSYSPPAWASFFVGLGAIGTIFGYVLARMWYWFRAA
jgi:hypothetical protein